MAMHGMAARRCSMAAPRPSGAWPGGVRARLGAVLARRTHTVLVLARRPARGAPWLTARSLFLSAGGCQRELFTPVAQPAALRADATPTPEPGSSPEGAAGGSAGKRPAGASPLASPGKRLRAELHSPFRRLRLLAESQTTPSSSVGGASEGFEQSQGSTENVDAVEDAMFRMADNLFRVFDAMVRMPPSAVRVQSSCIQMRRIREDTCAPPITCADHHRTLPYSTVKR